MASVKRGVLRSAAILALLALLVTGANLLFTAHLVRANDRKFCDVIHGMTAVPVPAPSDPAANPSREQNYEWYVRFVRLGQSLGC